MKLFINNIVKLKTIASKVKNKLKSKTPLHQRKFKTKEEIRKHFLKKRLSLKVKDVEFLSNLICFNVFKNIYILDGCTGLYYPMKNEVNPFFLFDLGLKEGALPFINRNSMSFKKWHINEISLVSKLGTLQPIETAEDVNPKIIIVPLVAFDERCYRVGYGGGFYDKFLANFKGIKIGIAFEIQKTQRIPEKEYDIKLDYIITEKNIYSSIE
jgi:5-formyltetrahydrofolate cyclo-ligase